MVMKLLAAIAAATMGIGDAPDAPPMSASSTATAAAQVGIGVHTLDARSVERVRGLGVRQVRTTLYWALWESDPAYARQVRADFARAANAGLDLLVVVHQAPLRYSYANRTAAYEAYADFVAARAREFPQVTAWQLWNEMDASVFTDLFGARNGVSMRDRGRLYGAMLQVAYPRIKAANPGALVVTGGIAYDPEDGFLAGLLETRAPWDALGVHVYGFPVRLPFRDRGVRTRRLLGNDPRPIWATEFGMEEAVIPQGFVRTRSEIDRHHLEAWRDPALINASENLYGRIYGHVLSQDGDTSFDLIRRDGSLRPAAQWLREFMR